MSWCILSRTKLTVLLIGSHFRREENGERTESFPQSLHGSGTFVISPEAWCGPKGWQLSRKEILEENIAFQSDLQSLCIQLFVFTQFPDQILQDPVPLNCPRGGFKGRVQGVPTSPLPRWPATFLFNKCSAAFLYIICQRRHSLVVHPFWKKSWIRPCVRWHSLKFKVFTRKELEKKIQCGSIFWNLLCP